MSARTSIKKPLPNLNNNSLIILICINAIVFVILNFLYLVYFLSYENNEVVSGFFTQQILDWFQVPANASKLWNRPWVLFTYMFSHFSVWSLISNMLWLCAFGYILQDLTGNKKLIPIYVYGGFVGAIIFVLSVNAIPAYANKMALIMPLIGGGAAVMAVAVATTTLAPNYRLLPFINGGIPLWVLTLIFVAIDYSLVATYGGGVALSHLAAALIGFLYILQLRKGNDWGEWIYKLSYWFNDLFNPERKKANKENKLYYKTQTAPYTKKLNITQQKLDEILDKINAAGSVDALTPEEKEFLERFGKN